MGTTELICLAGLPFAVVFLVLVLGALRAFLRITAGLGETRPDRSL